MSCQILHTSLSHTHCSIAYLACLLIGMYCSSLFPKPCPLVHTVCACTIYLRLDSSSTSAVLIKTRTNVCHGITAHTLWRFHSEHQVKSTQRAFGFFLQCFYVPSMPSCTHATKEASSGFGGVVNFCL